MSYDLKIFEYASLATLLPKERAKRLSQFSRAAHKDPKYAVHTLQEAASSQTIHPSTFRFLLRFANSPAHTIQYLTFDASRAAQCGAIDSFIFQWSRKSHFQALINALGNGQAFANILDQMSHRMAFRLVKGLRTKYYGDSDPRTRLLGESISGFLSPASRLGISLGQYLLPCVSATVLEDVLPRYSADIETKVWNMIRQNHPQFTASFIQAQTSIQDSAGTQRRNVVPQSVLRNLVLTREINGEKGSLPWGSDFFVSFLRNYAALHKSSSDPLQPEQDVLNYSSRRGTGRLEIIAGLTGIAVRGIKDPAKKLELLSQVVVLHLEIAKMEGKERLSPSEIDPILQELTKLYRKAHEIGNHPLRTEAVTSVITSLAAHSQQQDVSVEGVYPSLASLLHLLPLSLRFQFVALLHTAAYRHDLYRDPARHEDFPRYNPSLIAFFSPEDGRNILTRGIRSRPSDFALGSPSNGLFKASTLFNLSGSFQEPDSRSFARSAMIRAAFRDNLQEAKKDIQQLVKLAGQQSESSERVQYVRAILAICLLTRSIDLLTENIAWAFQRFAKDVEVRYLLLCELPSKRSLGNGDVFIRLLSGWYYSPLYSSSRPPSDLEAAGKRGDELLKQWLPEIEKALLEPDFRKAEHQSFRTLLAHVLDKRFEILADKRTKTSPEKLLQPLHDLLIAWERLALEHPDTLALDLLPHPTSFGLSIRVSALEAPVALRFLDTFGVAREELYTDHRDQLLALRSRGTFTRGRHFLAFGLSPSKEYTLSLSYSPNLSAYLERVLFAPREVMIQPIGAEIEADVYGYQWAEALKTFLSFSTSKVEVERKVQRLLDHYGPKVEKNGSVSAEDLRLLLLDHADFLASLWSCPRAAKNILSSVFDTPLLQTLGSNIREFDPMENVPPIPRSYLKFGVLDEEKTVLQVQAGIETEYTETTRAAWVMGARPTLYNVSYSTARRVGILHALNFIASVFESGPAEPSGVIPKASSAELDFSRLRLAPAFSAAISEAGLASDWQRRSMFKLSSVYLPSESLLELLRLVLTQAGSIGKKVELVNVQMRIISALIRSNNPLLAVEPAVEVLGTPAHSTWHRHVLHQGFLASLSSAQVSKLLERFHAVVVQGLAQPRAWKETKPENVPIKITSVKYLLQLCGDAHAFEPLQARIELMREMTVALAHHSVRTAIIQAALASLKRGSIGAVGAHATFLDPVWALLRDLSQYVGPADSKDVWLEKDWIEAEQTGSKRPLPTKHISANPLAAAFLSEKESSLPKSIVTPWAHLIDEMSGAQAVSRARWLRLYMSRHDATADQIELVKPIGPYPDFYASLLPGPMVVGWLPKLPANSEILRIVEATATAYLFPYHWKPFFESMDKKEENWRSSEEGRVFDSLAKGFAESLHYPTMAFTSLVLLLKNGDIPSKSDRLVDRETVQKVLIRIIRRLLDPAYLTVTAGQGQTTPPLVVFDTYRENLGPKAPAIDRGQWAERVRPVLEEVLRMLEETMRDAREKQQGVEYSDADYWESHILIQLALLPYPSFVPYSRSSSRYTGFAKQLLALVQHVVSLPSSHVWIEILFSKISRSFNDLLLSQDIFPTIDALLEESKKIPLDGIIPFELTIKILGAVSGKIAGDGDLRMKREALLAPWLTHKNGLVRRLALLEGNLVAIPEFEFGLFD